MITLLDGPAAGITLDLPRHPRVLRIVHNGGWIGALPDVMDEPQQTEIIYAYYRVGTLQPDHNQYRYHPQQPQDHILRDNQKWRTWATT